MTTTSYIDLFTPETWAAFLRRDRRITGFRGSQKTTAKRIKPGDQFFCYLVHFSRWVGILEVTSPVFEDSSPYFVEGSDPFVVRFKVNPVVVLPPEMGVPIKQLWTRLQMCEGIDPNSMGWPYRVGVARSLGEVVAADAEVLSQAIKQQGSNKTVYPLSAGERKRVEGKRTVSLPTETAVVEIPQDEDKEIPANVVAQTEFRRSLHIQSLLTQIGIDLGFKIWLPANDRAAVLRALSASSEEHVLKKLPLNADDNTVETVERIDVLWVKGRSIVRAFEVEDTTAVYSGILRMSDLIALQPQFRIKLHIVAPEERAEKVRHQILRPTFAYMEGGPLAKICTYLSYGAVEEIAKKKDLRFMRDEIVEEYEEVME